MKIFYWYHRNCLYVPRWTLSGMNLVEWMFNQLQQRNKKKKIKREFESTVQ